MPDPSSDLELALSGQDLDFRQVHVEMSDGVGLATDLYLPRPLEERVPVLLELLPYRKDEDRAGRYGLYRFFVDRGYAIARVDIRGTGQSEGTVPEYEYSEQEHDDAVELIEWLAQQPWSSGRVGMWGISWGGFNAIQLGMQAPEALGAIVAACATDDLFYDDVHYVDGLMHIDSYEIHQDLMNSVTSAPDFPVDEETLRARFDTEPWLLRKLEHPQDGPFWDRGSLNTDYSRLQVPALLLGGWHDGYRDSIPRMLEHVDVPVQAIVGPWPHRYPHNARPGPEVEWRERAVAWFDHFLRGEDNGVLDQPQLTYFLREGHPPDPDLATAPGEFKSAQSWPLHGAVEETWHLAEGRLVAEMPVRESVQRLVSKASVGFEAGHWWGDVRGDQAPLDRHALVFDSEPLSEPRVVLGLPLARLRVKSSAPTTNWFVRLSDVAPDGSVTLVTGAAASGAQRISPPEPLTPGEAIELDVELHFTSWTFEVGHRVRVAVTNSLWPMAWPTPLPVTSHLHSGPGGSSFVVPTVDRMTLGPEVLFREPDPGLAYPIANLELPSLPEPEDAEVSPTPAPWRRYVDESNGDSVLVNQIDFTTPLPWGERRFRSTIEYRSHDDHPARASVVASTSRLYRLPDRVVEWRGDFALRSDEQAFHYDYTRTLVDQGETLRERTWSRRFPRGLH